MIRPPLIDRLEPRTLLTLVPAGPEFRVHQYTANNQGDPGVAVDAGGNFVATWSSNGQDGSGYGVYARRFDSAGTPRGGEFRVNQTTASDQAWCAVSGAADGSFAVVWASWDQDGDLYGVFARLYDAAGVARGSEFRVNQTAAGNQDMPAVAMQPGGDFVVAWRDFPSDPMDSEIYARRYDAAGAPRGGEFRVRDVARPTSAPAEWPSVAVDAAGDFVVAWDAMEPDSSGGPAQARDVYARVFDAAGTPRGAEFLVNNPHPDLFQARASVAMNADGDLVVAWDGVEVPDGPLAVYARRFNRAGDPQGDEFHVHSASTSGGAATVAAAPDGAFVVAWAGVPQGAASQDVFARYYNAQGVPEGDPFVLNQRVGNLEAVPAVAVNRDGGFVAAWYSTDFSQSDVYARRFDVQTQPPASVIGRHVFYNHSALDGGDASANAADDAAIATDKVALLPGQSPSFANVSSFSHGLNGIMVDIGNLPAGGVLSPDDFDIGGDGTRVAGVSVRRGAGVDGSDRVTLTWPDFDTPTDPPSIAVGNGWLRVTVKANANTGLAAPDVFSFGNLIGETGDGTGANGWRVSALDLANVKRSLNTDAAVTSKSDFDRNGRTNALDLAVVRRALNGEIRPPPAEVAVQLAVRRVWEESGKEVLA